jgi:hypothetical protein
VAGAAAVFLERAESCSGRMAERSATTENAADTPLIAG